jgi:hypothetical protein
MPIVIVKTITKPNDANIQAIASDINSSVKGKNTNIFTSILAIVMPIPYP